MRGQDEQQFDVFSYVSPEQRVPQDHPLRTLRVMTNEALRELQPRFNQLYAKTGRPSIAPDKLLRALLLQALYSVRSERMLMEQLDYSLLFRWFVGLNMDDPIWDVTVFTKIYCGKFGIAESSRWDGTSPLLQPPTTWSVCGI